MITKILEAVKAQSSVDTDDSEKYLTTKKWEWTFLRVSLQCFLSEFYFLKENINLLQKECKNLDLDVFFRTYIHRMQRSYLSLLFCVQTLIYITHIIVLAVKSYEVSLSRDF